MYINIIMLVGGIKEYNYACQHLSIHSHQTYKSISDL